MSKETIEFRNRDDASPKLIGPATDYHATTISRRRRLRRSVAVMARRAGRF